MIELYEYPVTEIFRSIQGEGHFVGKRMVFIRLAHCNYNCRWCDTEFGKRFAATAQTIADKAVALAPKGTTDVTITGGEPMMYPLYDLIHALFKRFDMVHIETNGSFPDQIEQLEQLHGQKIWVTVSPKKPNGDPVWEWSGPGDELKLIHQGQDLSRFMIEGARLYLQPLWSDNPIVRLENLNRVLESMEDKPEWNLSVQIQKLIEMQ